MKAQLFLATIAALGIHAINLETLADLKSQVIEQTTDGPTNGEMTEDEKDSLIQVLCPGPVMTSYTLASGKSSTCNSGGKAANKALVQESETVGDITLE